MKKAMKIMIIFVLCITIVSPLNYASQLKLSYSTPNLLSSDSLFNDAIQGISSVSPKMTNHLQQMEVEVQINDLNELEYSKYEMLNQIEGLSDKTCLILAKAMAYRYLEATSINKSIVENSEKYIYDSSFSSVANSTSTDPRVAAYYVQNKPVAQQLYSDYISILNSPYIPGSERWLAAQSYRDAQFISYVKSGGPWDLKLPLGVYSTYNLLGRVRTGEYLGNHHYGYMGRYCGYSENYLKLAAGIVQVISGTSDWAYMSSYFDDPRDQAAIADGYIEYSIDLGIGIFY